MQDRWAIQNWTTGELNALVKNLGGEEIARKIQKGEVIIKIEEALQKLFDKNGRSIPFKGLRNAVCDPDKDFRLVQPEIKTMDDYARRLIRLKQMFSGPMPSVAEFESRTKELVSEIKNDKNLANLLNGIWLPIILPQIKAENLDYGKVMGDVFLPVVKTAYEKQFPGRKFYNYRQGELANEVSIVKGLRHERLVERMKQGIVYAIYFPNPFQGFSVLAAREQMAILPESLLLSGGFDASTAQVMYPDVLAKDWHTPGYDLSATSWRPSGSSLYFKAHDDRLYFDSGAALGAADDRFSSGLLFLGKA